MEDTIHWMRFKEICEDILRIMRGERLTVNLYISTDVPKEMMAAVGREGQRVDIALNALYNKVASDVIENLAHELVHIIDDSDEHPDDFRTKAEVVQRAIIRNYIR